MWLCARFPLLVLDRELPCAQSASPQAYALVSHRNILEANRTAFERGVRPGQSLNTARSLCPDLQCRPPSPERMQHRLEQLALWAYRFTPDVSLLPPASLLLNIQGSLKLFGGFAPLYQRFQWGYRKRHVPVAYGFAHTPLAAQLFSYASLEPARFIQSNGLLNIPALIEAVDRLAVSHLPCDHKIQEQLGTMGLHNIGQLRALPRPALNRRFGKNFGHLIGKLYGDEPDPQAPFHPPDTFYSERQFNGGLTRAEELRFPMAVLLSDLEHYLQLKQWINRHLNWQFSYCDGQHDALSMPMSHQHFDRRRTLGLVLLKLEQFRLRGPVDTLSLQCDQFEGVAQTNDELFSHASLFDHQRHERFLAVLDKLQTRLGADSFWQPTLANEHLPEQAVLRSHPLTPHKNTPLVTNAQRPLWLLEQAQALREHEGQPCWPNPLHLLQGPERIDTQWWQQRQVRDYYIARADNGALCWVYRDCLQQRWYLHGLFG